MFVNFFIFINIFIEHITYYFGYFCTDLIIKHSVDMVRTRGIRNKNPFNIKLSQNSWLGKVSTAKNTDRVFEQFREIDYGLRAGMQLLRGYISRGYDTPEKIVRRFAPSSENNTNAYLCYVLESPLHADDNLSTNSLNFYWLCKKICMYESQYDFKYDDYIRIKQRFRL